MIKMAIEVGGTFTDLIWIEGDNVRSHKLPSTPHDASIGVIDGLSQSLGADLPKLTHLFHGSTVATNAVIERKGCRAAFLTTRGFRDLLVLQRQLRPNVYAIACEKPEPLIPLKRFWHPISATSAAPGRLDRGDVDLLHLHPCIKCALRFIAASRQCLG
jgi:N-methylhydantoinase A/oxoprolinase/acetone carboxylase beta subunit